MQPSSFVNWTASLNIDGAFLFWIAPIGIAAGIGSLVFRALFGRFIGTASTVGTTKAGIAAGVTLFVEYRPRSYC